MKRHPALQDLSRDHHRGLIECQKIRRALNSRASGADLRALATDLLAYHKAELSPHFLEEEGHAFAAAQRTGDPHLAAVTRRLLEDHAWLRAKLQRLSVARVEELVVLLSDIERRLDAHLRMEESELFEGLQRLLTEGDFERLLAASYAFRSKHRSPDDCTVKPKSA